MGSAVASSSLAASLQVGLKAASLQGVRASARSPANDMSLSARFQAAIGLPSNVTRRDGLLARADKLKSHSTSYNQVGEGSAHKRKLEVSAVANAPSRTQIAASPALTGFPETTAGKRPAASKPPTDLSKDALELALNAAVLSALAYKTPVEVEYLRQKAKGLTRDQAKGYIFEGKGLPALLELKEDKDLKKTLEQILDELEEEDKRLGYADLLRQFEDAPADFFDGRNGLFVKTTEAFMFRHPRKDQQDILYVVFRGTSEPLDLIADLTAFPESVYKQPAGKRQPDLKLHCGFRDQYVAVSTALSKKVEAVSSHHDEKKPAGPTEPLPKGSPPDAKAKLPSRIQDLHTVGVKNLGEEGVHMVFAGHSLGAAVAAIASFVFAKERVAGDTTTRISYFGFGSPRVGNAAFAREYKQLMQDQKSSPAIKGHVYHFANEYDPVPGVPLPLGFRHVTGGYVLREGAEDLGSGLKALTRVLANHGPVMQDSSQHVMSACVPKPLADEADAGLMAFAGWTFAGLKYVSHLLFHLVGQHGTWIRDGVIFRGKPDTPWEEHDVGKYYVPRIRYLLEQATSSKNAVTHPAEIIEVGTAPAANGVQVA